MVMSTMVIGWKVIRMDKEFINIKIQEMFTMEIGLMVKNLEKVFINMQMEIYMKEDFMKVKSMEREY